MDVKTGYEIAMATRVVRPAIIIPVRTYAGETEAEALAQAGYDPENPGVVIEFIHIA